MIIQAGRVITNKGGLKEKDTKVGKTVEDLLTEMGTSSSPPGFCGAGEDGESLGGLER